MVERLGVHQIRPAMTLGLERIRITGVINFGATGVPDGLDPIGVEIALDGGSSWEHQTKPVTTLGPNKVNPLTMAPCRCIDARDSSGSCLQQRCILRHPDLQLVCRREAGLNRLGSKCFVGVDKEGNFTNTYRSIAINAAIDKIKNCYAIPYPAEQTLLKALRGKV